MKRIFITLVVVIALFSNNTLMGQILLMKDVTMEDGTPVGERFFFNSANVSNEGTVCGYPAARTPYFLWYPEAGIMKDIGGIGPGDGVGGRAVFSTDGTYISGSAEGEEEVSTQWHRKVLDRNCTFVDIVPSLSGGTFAVGKSIEDDKGVVANAGGGEREKRWTEIYSSQYDSKGKAITTISFPSYQTGNAYEMGFIGGYGILAKTPSSGYTWKDMAPIAEHVTCNKILDFVDGENGVACVLLDKEYAVYVTADGGTVWTQATGVTGEPVSITHVDADTYYMVTLAGTVQKSTDKGNTWSNIATGMNNLRKIRFNDTQNGMIMAQGAVYRTTDGGLTWNPIEIAQGVTGQITWNDAAWQDAQNLLLVGSKDVIYTSADGGNTWTWANEAMSDGKTQLNAISVNGKYIQVCGDSSTFYKKALSNKEKSIGMARYNVEKNQWSTLGDLGSIMADVTGAAYSISGDGKIVVGLAQCDFDENKLYDKNATLPPSCNATVWTEEKGCVSLGSLVTEDNTRCNAMNQDGSILVGYQARSRMTGLWVAAVWNRNNDGSYTQRYLFNDPAIGETSEENFLPECNAISANGKWIGGTDDGYHKSSWIWSEETGVIELDATKNIVYISNDGTFVVGKKFIWVKEKGSMSIADYLKNEKGYDLDALLPEGYRLDGITGVSSKGRYIVGYGSDGKAVSTYRIDLGESAGIREETTDSQVAIYPNPASDLLTIGHLDGNTELRLFDSCGRMVISQSVTSPQVTVPVTNLAEGIYYLNIANQGSNQTHKVQVVH